MAIGFRRGSRHWRSVGYYFVLDAVLVWLSFIAGSWVRFGQFPLGKLVDYAPGIFLASIVLPSIFYIGGFYAKRVPDEGILRQLRWFCFGLLGVALSVLAIGSIDFSSRIGRGVFAVAFSLLAVLLMARHLFLVNRRNARWETILCLVTGQEDEAAATLLGHLWGKQEKILGVATAMGYRPVSELPVIGSIDEISKNQSQAPVDVLLVREQHLTDPAIGNILRSLRYRGVEIVSLADACEDAYHAVPLGLITDSWLFRSSNQAGLFYIKKLKRLFDIFAALFFLIVLFPFFVLGAVIVKLASPGPVLFRQVRAGRLERPITIVKLRTMHLDANDGGAKWAEEGDPRIFPAGKILRQFRIDEIPQLVNVLKGDMSFVGPRPEQAEMIEDLDRQVPFYRERLLIQPGLTGWAQVCYPYGATIDDAARKLEYDLYYMKHMSVFLDCFILLETIKIILGGGVTRGGDGDYSRFRQNLGPASVKRIGEDGKISEFAAEPDRDRSAEPVAETT